MGTKKLNWSFELTDYNFRVMFFRLIGSTLFYSILLGYTEVRKIYLIDDIIDDVVDNIAYNFWATAAEKGQ